MTVIKLRKKLIEKIVMKLGHYPDSYRGKGARALTRPVNMFIATAIIATTFSFSELKAQENGDTITGTGYFVTQNAENGDNVGNVDLYLRPISIALDTIYEFTTQSVNGGAEFELPVYLNTGIEEFAETSNTAFPNPGSEINVFMPSVEKGFIEFYNVNGQLVKRNEFNSDHAYLALDGVATGVGFYKIGTEEGAVITGKYVKTNSPQNGPASRPSSTNLTFKATQLFEATYSAKWVKEGFVTDSTEIVIYEGVNPNPFFFQMTPIAGVPQNQDFVGIAKDANNNYAPLANITAILFNQTLNETNTVITGSDGEYVFEDVPTGSVCFLSVGGNSSKYSFNDIPYTVPTTIVNPSDTLLDIFSTVLPDKLASSTDFHIIQQTSHGTQETERKYWYHSSISTVDKTVYEGYFDQLEAMGNEYTYVETLNQNEANIEIIDGTFNTMTSENLVVTPFGNLYPVYFASCTMNTAGDFGSFSHEIYQANGKSQVGWYSVLGSSPPSSGPTVEDLDIAELDMNYWVNHVYGNEETFVDLNLISEELESKSPQFKNNQSNSFGTE